MVHAAETLPNEKHLSVVEEARCGLVKGACDDIFVDCQTSPARQPEFARGISTCIRPSHAIWSTRLERHLSPQELWRCQGLFPAEFPGPPLNPHKPLFGIWGFGSRVCRVESQGLGHAQPLNSEFLILAIVLVYIYLYIYISTYLYIYIDIHIYI